MGLQTAPPKTKTKTTPPTPPTTAASAERFSRERPFPSRATLCRALTERGSPRPPIPRPGGPRSTTSSPPAVDDPVEGDLVFLGEVLVKVLQGLGHHQVVPEGPRQAEPQGGLVDGAPGAGVVPPAALLPLGQAGGGPVPKGRVRGVKDGGFAFGFCFGFAVAVACVAPEVQELVVAVGACVGVDEVRLGRPKADAGGRSQGAPGAPGLRAGLVAAAGLGGGAGPVGPRPELNGEGGGGGVPREGPQETPAGRREPRRGELRGEPPPERGLCAGGLVPGGGREQRRGQGTPERQPAGRDAHCLSSRLVSAGSPPRVPGPLATPVRRFRDRSTPREKAERTLGARTHARHNRKSRGSPSPRHAFPEASRTSRTETEPSTDRTQASSFAPPLEGSERFERGGDDGPGTDRMNPLPQHGSLQANPEEEERERRGQGWNQRTGSAGSKNVGSRGGETNAGGQPHRETAATPKTKTAEQGTTSAASTKDKDKPEKAKEAASAVARWPDPEPKTDPTPGNGRVRGSPEDHTSAATRGIVFLEEQVRIHEATLRAWRQRRDKVSEERQRTAARKRRLLLRRDALVEKQRALEDARARHLSLREELVESLAMSRERLNRLTALESVENEAGDGSETDQETPAPGVGVAASPSRTEDRKDAGEGTETRAVPDTNLPRGTGKLPQNPPAIDYSVAEHRPIAKPARTFEEVLLSRHRSNDPESFAPNRRSLSAFLPHLDAFQVEKCLTLMLREASAMEHDGNSSGGSDSENENESENDNDVWKSAENKHPKRNSEQNPRKRLLENTCLDVLLLVPFVDQKSAETEPPENLPATDLASVGDDKEGEEQCNDQDTGTTSETGEFAVANSRYINPNITLCPYELAGICADDLCPYQHTQRTKTILPRELLPLPSLSSFVSKTVEARTKQNALPATPTQSMPITDASHETPAMPAKENVGGEAEEEDLLVLPPLDSSPDDDGDEAMTETGGNSPGNKGNGDSGSEIDSADEWGDYFSPTVGPSGATEAANPGRRSRNNDWFWWSARLAIGGVGKAEHTEAIPRARPEKRELSIREILKETFGIFIREHQDSKASKDATISNGEESSSTSCYERLEVKGAPVPSHCGSRSEIMLRNMEFFGRLVDASRLALHGGLDSVAFALYQELRRSHTVQDGSLEKLIDLVGAQINFCRFYGRESRVSFFQAAFASQAGLSIASWCAAGYGRMHESGTTMALFCSACWEILGHPVAVERTADSDPFDGDTLKEHFWNQHGTVRDGVSGIRSDTDNPSTNTAVDAPWNLHSIIRWALSNASIPLSNSREVSVEQVGERLNATWLTAVTFLNEYEDQRRSDDNASPQVEKSNWDLQCLKVAIVVGYAIFGALANFTTTVVETSEGRRPILSVGNLAAWTVLDGAVARITKGLRKRFTNSTPLMDAILAPIYACSIASSSFLRNYSAAHHRLTECLGEGFRAHGTGIGDPSLGVLAYSELLWSQLVQLRMSLPNDSPPHATKDSSVAGCDLTASGAKQADSARDKRNEGFPWEPSQAVKVENKHLVAKLRSRGILLRHVVLWGDWLLLSSLQNISERNKLLPSGVRSEDRTLDFGFDLIRSRKRSHSPADNPRRGSGHQYPPPPPLPQLPLQLLHLGHSIQVLNLDRCSLDRLPRSFGLYFPNLKELILSNNNLSELPESFRGLTEHMTSLEVFNAARNQLTSLPATMFSHAATAALSSSSPPPLKLLDLSENRLSALPSLVNLVHLEILRVGANQLIEISPADWSRLVLKRPSLRQLSCDHQGESQPTKRDKCHDALHSDASRRNRPETWGVVKFTTNTESIGHGLVKGLCGALLLAVLQLLVKKGARLGIPVAGLEAVKKQLLVVGTDPVVRGGRHLLRLGGRGGGVVAAAAASSAHGSDGGTHGLVGNGATGSKGHSLGNGRSDSREHAASAGLLLHGSGGRRRGSGGGGCLCGCGAGWWGGRTGCGPASTHATSSSTSLWVEGVERGACIRTVATSGAWGSCVRNGINDKKARQDENEAGSSDEVVAQTTCFFQKDLVGRHQDTPETDVSWLDPRVFALLRSRNEKYRSKSNRRPCDRSIDLSIHPFIHSSIDHKVFYQIPRRNNPNQPFRFVQNEQSIEPKLRKVFKDALQRVRRAARMHGVGRSHIRPLLLQDVTQGQIEIGHRILGVRRPGQKGNVGSRVDTDQPVRCHVDDRQGG
ncbi:unnamed protein product [Pseudo-nitzschia multistriata]|uniref:C3H1-type domain-containing protein n=1 Tax=Pseudo-nitzschia multistriata TaxID=183589 RepID=A0A448YUZ3_9STRA|nr:unnamed protein product [Pseudo-nitzschia multistriata]